MNKFLLPASGDKYYGTVAMIKRLLTEGWSKTNYELTIEPEVFWRRGAPPRRPDVRLPESR